MEGAGFEGFRNPQTVPAVARAPNTMITIHFVCAENI